MPTSGTTVWTQTAADLMLSAAYELGAIPMGDEMEASEEAEMIKRFNGMIQTWATEGNLYRDETGTLTIPGGTGAASLPAEVRDIRSVRHILSATNYRILAPWNRDQYYAFPNRAAVGNPTIFYYQQGAETDVIRIWPVPADDIDLELDYGRAAYAVTSPEETLDIPQDWWEAAMYGLAARCAGIFGSVKLDPANVQRITAQAAAAYQRLLDQDRPDSYYFEPDNRYCGVYG